MTLGGVPPVMHGRRFEGVRRRGENLARVRIVPLLPPSHSDTVHVQPQKRGLPNGFAP